MRKIGFVPSVAASRKLTNVAPIDFRHVSIEGDTGSGKTVSLIYPNIRERIEKNHAIFVPIYKGHEDRTIKAIARECGRLEDVYEIGKPTGVHINFLSHINLELFKDHLINNYHSSDPYWITTATSWFVALQKSLVTTKELLERLEAILDEGVFHDFATLKIPIGMVQKKRINEFTFEEFVYDLTKEPSFTSIGTVTKNASLFSNFIKVFDLTITDLETAVKEAVEKADAPKFLLQRCFLLAKRVRQELRPLVALNFDKGASSSGNNGVLEILNNVIEQFSGYHFFNEEEVDVVELLEGGKIVIVDLESLSEGAVNALYDSIAERLARRVKEGRELTPISIFIDEANKVLPANIDLYNDVFRESKVELFISYQNEEQMIQKFGPYQWTAFKNNFKHQYSIERYGDERYLEYNGQQATIERPVIFSQKELYEADADFYALKKNRKRIEDRFVYENLPERFAIAYRANEFQRDRKVWAIEAGNGSRRELFYCGGEVREEFEDLYANNPHIQEVVEYYDEAFDRMFYESAMKEVGYEEFYEDCFEEMEKTEAQENAPCLSKAEWEKILKDFGIADGKEDKNDR